MSNHSSSRDAELLAAFPPGGDTVVDRAEAALRRFYVQDRQKAEELLSTWKYSPALSSRERNAVLARFARRHPMNTLPALPGCGQPATAHYELYSAAEGRLLGSLDASLYLCAGHDEEIRAIPGLSPFRTSNDLPAGLRCGSGWDYLAGAALRAGGSR